MQSVEVGGRRWIWSETMFLNAVLPMGVEGGAPDESALSERIKYALLAAKGIPLVKQQVVYQYVNDRDTDPQIHEDAEGEAPTLNGIFVTLWIQVLRKAFCRAVLTDTSPCCAHRPHPSRCHTVLSVATRNCAARKAQIAGKVEEPT
mmetsp:Transcript_15349/g.40568  ORF Transcript_15349/g.40568 Transcript_15349/m.40568 type:complete len:147 (-) Transcript_15349:183-623(-)